MIPELRAILRTSLLSFVMKVFETLHPGQPPLDPAWYLRAICHLLEEARCGRLRRSAIAVPPRHLKSITAAVAFPAWLLGHDPTAKIMVASYSQDLARQHAEQFRTIIESAWYRSLFPKTRISNRANRQLETHTTAGGARKAVSVEGSLTGFGADIIIVDDCMKADEAQSQAVRDATRSWFDNTLGTRLNDKARGVIVSIQQRLHEDDLPAYLFDKGYARLELPAIAEREETIELGAGQVHHREVGDLLNPAREDQVTLDRLRRELGPQVFSAQYQQNPVVPGGNLIRLDWFSTYEEVRPRSWYHKIVQSWDTAETSAPTSDWSVCQTWGFREERWYLLDLFRERLDYPDLKRAVLRLRGQWSPDRIIVEQANSGRSLVIELRIEGCSELQLYRPKGDKETRLIGQTGQLETGMFHLPAAAPWLDAFRSELRAFPMGRHDDQVDSLTQFLEYQLRRWKEIREERTPGGRIRSIVREHPSRQRARA